MKKTNFSMLFGMERKKDYHSG